MSNTHKENWKVKIGMLRQWLNEDRIKDAERFVTNKDLEDWLDIATTVAEAIKTAPHRYCESETMRDNYGNPYPCNCGVSEWIDSKLKSLEAKGE